MSGHRLGHERSLRALSGATYWAGTLPAAHALLPFSAWAVPCPPALSTPQLHPDHVAGCSTQRSLAPFVPCRPLPGSQLRTWAEDPRGRGRAHEHQHFTNAQVQNTGITTGTPMQRGLNKGMLLTSKVRPGRRLRNTTAPAIDHYDTALYCTLTQCPLTLRIFLFF